MNEMDTLQAKLLAVLGTRKWQLQVGAKIARLQRALGAIGELRASYAHGASRRRKNLLDDPEFEVLLTERLPGAGIADIRSLERLLGKELPLDVTALLLLHNGEDQREHEWAERNVHVLTTLPEGLCFLSVDEIAEQWSKNARFPPRGDRHEIAFEEPRVRASSSPPSRSVIPLAKAVGLGDQLWVDLDPTDLGTYGQLIYNFEVEVGFLAGSLVGFLERYANLLERGILFGDLDNESVIAAKDRFALSALEPQPHETYVERFAAMVNRLAEAAEAAEAAEQAAASAAATAAAAAAPGRVDG